MSTPLQVGISVGPNGLPIEEAVELAGRAEEAGLDIVGCGDAGAENLALMGAIAARTSSIELVSCALTWARTPVTLAAGARTLAELSKGRYRFAVGTMPRAWSEGWHGVDYSRPLERMRDYVAATRAALSARPGEPVNHAGPYYELRDYIAFGSPPEHSIRLHLAPSRPGMSQLAGEIADGALFNVVHSQDQLGSVLLPALARGLESAGRERSDVELGCLVFCAISESEDQALELLRPGIGLYFGVPYFTDLLRHHGFEAELEAGLAARAQQDDAAAVDAVSDRLVRAVGLAGSEAEVAEKLRAYEELVDWVLLCAPIAQTPDVVREQTVRIVERFGRTSDPTSCPSRPT